MSTRAAPPSSKAFPGGSGTEGQPVRAPGALGVAEKVLTSRGEKPRVAVPVLVGLESFSLATRACTLPPCFVFSLLVAWEIQVTLERLS